MIEPKLVITEDEWDDMSPVLQSKVMYRTTIALRNDVINLSTKIDSILNKPTNPCIYLEKRIGKLEKGKFLKNTISFLGGVLGGFGGSHLPK